MAPDAVYELRALDVQQPDGSTRTVFGYFDEARELAAAAASIDRAGGIYITLNPCRRDLLQRARNRTRIASVGDTTGNADIISRRFMLIDADPVRPRRTSATHGEAASSLDRCEEITRWLQARGWPELPLAMSGNGAHLLARIELPADDGGLVRSFLGALARRFSDATVKIDTAVHNAARISKLYGTIAAKGEDTADRPHRRAALLQIPDTLCVVPRELLARCIDVLGSDARPNPTSGKDRRDTNRPADRFAEARDRWLTDHEIEYPRAIGWCPACGHNECFHAVPEAPHRWICFSSDHGADSDGCGKEGHDGLWSGDGLDLAAHEQGLSPAALLQREGYLVRPPPRSADERAPTPGTSSIPVGPDAHENAAIAASLVPQEDRAIVASTRTLDLARGFAAAHCLAARYAGDYYTFGPSGSTPISDEELTRNLWLYLQRARYVDPKDDTEKHVRANSGQVADCTNALIATVGLVTQTPCWLDDRVAPSPADLVQVGNGLLHLPDRRMLPSDPAFFTTTRIATRYVSTGTQPTQWLRFLDEVFAADRAAIDLLQEWFGYVISGRTDQQKILLMIGAIRCGKGTIARVLRALLGPTNVAAPSLSTLHRDFALGALLHKTLAIFPDARISGRPENNAVVLERLLSISGEDAVSVDRKFKPEVTVELPVRFMILSNELPSIADASGALANRFLILPFGESFLGREDRELTTKLVAETEAILRWSLDGLDRLLARGHFVQPPSGAAEKAELNDLTSPAGQFVRECCLLGENHEDSTEDLFAAWRWWCGMQGRPPGTKPVCMRDLRNAARLLGCKLKAHTPRVEGTTKRKPMLQGIRLLPDVRKSVEQAARRPADPDGEPPPF